MATKKLAKELGLIRKSSRSSQENRGSRQLFSYLIVIDFESTCWKEKKSYGQEIIEFPAVLLNTSNGKIESEFHTYVQPQEHSTLSDFCTELTGIKQEQVEAGVPLQICLPLFTRWLETLQREKNIVFVKNNVCPPTAYPCAFVTWSDWDLGVCLQNECKRKQICKPEQLNRWIDLRATYKLFYNRKPKGLNGALQDLGIEFSGREHSGLDDARNTAHLAWRMITDGCLMKVTKSLELVSGFFLGPGSATRPLFQVSQTHPNLKKRAKETNQFECDATKNTPKQTESVEKPNRITEINSHTDACQSLVVPKTLLDGFTTSVVQAGVPSQEFNRQRSFRSPLSAAVPSQVSTSLELVSTTFNSVTDAAADFVALASKMEESSLLVETEEPFSYDDVVLDDENTSDSTCAKTSEYILEGMKSKSLKADLSSVCTSSARSNQTVLGSSNTTVYSAGNSRPAPFNVTVFKMLPSAYKPGIGTNCSSLSNFIKPDCGPETSTKPPGFQMPTSKCLFLIYKDDSYVSNDPRLSSSHSLSTSSLAPSSLNKTFMPSVSCVVNSNVKVTSPLCNCGRRAKRLTVANGGPNHGRVFYSCPVGKMGSGNKKGCGFFKWGSVLFAAKSRTSSTSLCFKQTSKSFLSEKSSSNLHSPPLKKFVRFLRH
ncbi:ERI1 exoribonuclease 2 [Arapaima gigas]